MVHFKSILSSFIRKGKTKKKCTCVLTTEHLQSDVKVLTRAVYLLLAEVEKQQTLLNELYESDGVSITLHTDRSSTNHIQSENASVNSISALSARTLLGTLQTDSSLEGLLSVRP
jgi:ABC-type uncharacterized transport system ATPase subunit